MRKLAILVALLLVNFFSNDAQAQRRVFGHLEGLYAVVSDPYQSLRYEIALDLDDSTRIDTVTISNFGGNYYLVGTGLRSGKGVVVAYNLELDGDNNLSRLADDQKSLGRGTRHSCIAKDCIPCSFILDGQGMIIGCTSGERIGQSGIKSCDHTVRSDE